MASEDWSGRGLWIALAAVGLAIGLTAVIALGIESGDSSPTGGPSPTGISSGASLGPSAGAVGSPAVASTGGAGAVPSLSGVSVSCQAASQPIAALAGDPCPSAIVAVELAVAPVRLPIKRIVLEPGPLYCGVVWEGYASSPPACRSAYVPPGTTMHAYVSFAYSPKVAVVFLGVDLSGDFNKPLPSRPPWISTLVAFEVPPAGWVMP